MATEKINKYNVDENLENEFNFGHLKRLLKYLSPHKKTVAITLIFMICISALSLSGPYLIKIAIDTMIPNQNIVGLAILAGAYLCIFITSAILLKYRMRLMVKLGQQIIHDMRSDIFKKIQELPFTYYDSRPHGKILIRVVNYINSMSDLLSNGLIDMITNLVTLVLIIGLMLSLNIKLALLSFAVLPFLFVGIMIIKKFQRKAWQLNSAKNSNLTAYMHESIAGMKITQSFVREKKNFGIFEKLSYEVKDSWMGAVRWQFMTPILIDILAFVATGLIYFSSLYFNFGITIETGVLIAFISYNERFWQPIAGLGNFYNSIITAMAYLERIFETLDERPTVVDIPDAAIMPTIKGDVEFRNVFFGYEPGNLILEDLNFKISAGETIALVGPTGAGKTTIVNLLSRFYNINSGQILIDGVDIGMVTLSSLRKQMGVMMQDTFIFSGTIADNIRYSKLDATDEEVIAAAKVVRAHDFIVDMEHGYDTQVSEKGSRLSSGQRQLLSFARALLANPKILILDEATSSIDTETELRLQEGLNRLLEGRTSFVIAHRLSTIKNATRIMVIDNKNILEQGSHDELISLGGAYHNLYTAQLDSD